MFIFTGTHFIASYVVISLTAFLWQLNCGNPGLQWVHDCHSLGDLLTIVNQHVRVQTALPGEHCATFLTFKLLLATVHQHVGVEAAFPGESFATLVALKLLLTAVSQPVNVEAALSGEQATTLIALKLLFSSVCDRVSIEAAFPSESTSTFFALILFFSAVHQPVGVQAALPGEELSTHLTGIPLFNHCRYGSCGSDAGEPLVRDGGDGSYTIAGLDQHVSPKVGWVRGQEAATVLTGKLILSPVHNHLGDGIVLISKLFTTLFTPKHVFSHYLRHPHRGQLENL